LQFKTNVNQVPQYDKKQFALECCRRISVRALIGLYCQGDSPRKGIL
jgi:hypothetical protein